MERTKLSDQVRRHAAGGDDSGPEDTDMSVVVSTGSTLLDLAISGGRVPRGGIPTGILVEVFGPSSTGKTVILSEIAGAVRRAGGQVMFRDPEARLNSQFAKLFDLDVDEVDYDIPATVTDVFEPVREWDPGVGPVHGVFADSLAALTTQWEEEGKDNYGMRRAKEFSEQCRLTCRTLVEKNILMVCSNQVRQNLDAGPYGQKYKSPGGEAIGFYASLRLRTKASQKITRTRKVKGKEVKRTIGVETEVEVFKSSVWEPYRTATLPIIYDYGIDDIRANLKFIKDMTGASKYMLGGEALASSMEAAIEAVEEDERERELEDETIEVWQELEAKFRTKRAAKRRRREE